MNLYKLRDFSIFKYSRLFYSDSIKVKSIQYKENGDPEKVLQYVERDLDCHLTKGNVLVQFLSAVIHPSDINTIQGQYPIKPPLPAIGGNEGYAQVLKVGDAVRHLKPGDRVIPRHPNSGTWTTHKICPEGELLVVDPAVDDAATGAVMTVNPGTAYRMLRDFISLNTGDWVAQTGGTSAVGVYVTQLARHWGLNTLSIIRGRETPEDTAVLKRELKLRYGASVVLTEEEARRPPTELVGCARLALNCVGGRAALPLLRLLGEGGSLVSYGGMGGQPLAVPVSALIFSDTRLRGFWMSRWTEQRRNDVERARMLTELADMFRTGILQASPCHKHRFRQNEWAAAVSASTFKQMSPTQLAAKNVFIMD